MFTGGAGTTIWSHKTNDEHKIELYFRIKPEKDNGMATLFRTIFW